MNTVKEIMCRVHTRYEEIFATGYYPSFGGTGFTERNLTYYFCSQFERLLAENEIKPVIWQEAPMKKDGNTRDHLDSLIIVGDTAYLVEAKRLNMKGKVYSIKDDIDRLKKVARGKIEVEGLENVRRFVIVALTDIWIPHSGRSRETKLGMRRDFESNCVEQGLSLCFDERVKSLDQKVESEDYYLICFAGELGM